MTVSGSSTDRFIKEVERRDKLRKIAFWAISVSLLLPVGATAWLMIHTSTEPGVRPEAVIGLVGNEVSEMKEVIAEQSRANNAQRAQIATAQDSMQQLLKRDQARLEGLELQNRVQARVAEAEHSMVAETAKRNETLQTKIETVANSLTATSDQLKSSVGGLRQSVGDQGSAITAVRDQITAIRASVIEQLRSNQDEILARLRSIEASEAKASSTLAALDNRVSKLEAQVLEMRRPGWIRRMLDRISRRPADAQYVPASPDIVIDPKDRSLHLFGVPGYIPLFVDLGSKRASQLLPGSNEIVARIDVDRIVFKTSGLGSISCHGMEVSSASTRFVDQAGLSIPDIDLVTITSSSGSVRFPSRRLDHENQRALKSKLDSFCRDYAWR